MAIPRRGLRDIRTLSGKVDQTSVPYKAYMKLSCLEMEKLRRGKEKESASKRIADIDARLKEVESEKTELSKTLKERNNGNSKDAPGNRPKPASRRNTGAFKFRY